MQRLACVLILHLQVCYGIIVRTFIFAPPNVLFYAAPPHFVSNCHVLRPHVNFITSSRGICVQLPILLLLHLQMSSQQRICVKIPSIMA